MYKQVAEEKRNTKRIASVMYQETLKVCNGDDERLSTCLEEIRIPMPWNAIPMERDGDKVLHRVASTMMSV